MCSRMRHRNTERMLVRERERKCVCVCVCVCVGERERDGFYGNENRDKAYNV